MTTSFGSALCVPLLFAAFCSTGCVSSSMPLSDEKTSQPDMRLLGRWVCEDYDDKMTCEVVKKADSPKVLQIIVDNTAKQRKETLDLFLTQVREDYLASVAMEIEDKVKYLLVKYELLADGNLKISILDTDYFTKALKDKQIKGTLTTEMFKVTLEETPENLRKFLEKHAANCYSKEEQLTVKRVKEPPPK